jgi:general secretion pathway protein D
MGAAALLFGALFALSPPPLARAAETAAGEANLNFVGADIDTVIKAVGQYTNITFVIDPRVKGTISLVSEKPVSKAQALRLLSSALRLQGYAVVMSDGYAKVVPEADAKLQVSPTQSGAVRGDQIATRIYRLNYESAANLVAVLRPLISPNNTINANVGTNSLVITDYADNLKRLGKIIAALDAPASADLDVVPVQYAVASDIAQMVNRLLEPGAAGAAGAPGAVDTGRVSLLADPRTNAVIIRAPSVARANLAKSLIAKLDLPTAQPGNVHVVYLKNAEATKLALTLRAVVGFDTSANAASQPNNGAGSTNPGGGLSSLNSASTGGGFMNAAANQPSAPSQAQGPLPSGGTAGFIQADAATNSLIITASEPVYRNLRSVIEQLDARRAQVYIESLIVEVTSTNADELGIQWAGLSGNNTSSYRVGTITGFSTGGNNLINQLITQATPNGVPTAPSNGLNLGVFRQINGALTLGAIAHALASQSDTNILSMPNLITLDNEEARIIVGQNVPFVTGQFTTPASAGAAGVNPFQTIERKDVGLSLRVRPQVSEGGTVKMAIYQETSNLLPTKGGASDLITSKRSLETNVLVDDGQIIVLGGLIEDSVNDGVEKVPGLGDIPVVGNLFKYRTRSRAKTNLMVFLRPTVIRSNEQSVNVAADRYDFIRNLQIAKQPEQTIVLPHMDAPVLPQLQDGRMVDGPLYNKNVPGDTENLDRPRPQKFVPALPPAEPTEAPMDRLLN